MLKKRKIIEKNDEIMQYFSLSPKMNTEILSKLNKLLEQMDIVSYVEEDTDKLELVDYTDKSIVVFGKTSSFKEELKKMNGKYNPNLKNNEETCSGWVFSKNKKNVVSKFVNDVNSIYNVKLTLKTRDIV